jgi:hypothetical protein
MSESNTVVPSRLRFSATELTSVVVAILAFLGAIVSAFYTYSNRNRELDIKFVEIGLSVLRADPKETQTNGARGWAIKIIENYSGEKFSEEAKKELLTGPIKTVAPPGGAITIPTPDGGFLNCSLNPATGLYDICRSTPRQSK